MTREKLSVNTYGGVVPMDAENFKDALSQIESQPKRRYSREELPFNKREKIAISFIKNLYGIIKYEWN